MDELEEENSQQLCDLFLKKKKKFVRLEISFICHNFQLYSTYQLFKCFNIFINIIVLLSELFFKPYKLYIF